MDKFKPFLSQLIPPLLLSVYRRTGKYGFFGDYQSWQAAYQDTTGYDAAVILEKVKDSLLKVKEGKAVYARDSVIFDQIHYSFPLLASLLRIAVENEGRLSVLDFGGSLGTTYYQCKGFLSGLKELRWNIVEQENFVATGKQHFEDAHLKFFYDIDSCLHIEKPDVILLSGVVQCLEHPYGFLENLVNYNFKHILFDRTPFVKEGGDRLTIQKVPPEIYAASYPAWFFDRDKFLSHFQEQYEFVFEFDALADVIELKKPYAIAHDKGFFFQKKGF